MKSLIIIIIAAIVTLQTLNAQQEKRLALVIGNANYDKGALDNPVNDALLMEKTLKSLDFDVILDTNIATLQEFNSTVRKFGDKRDEYNVGFIYYAGHGVQINSENYLLATKEKYASEYDVDDNALSVQKIMRYLTNKTNQVNVLILDACRDNPFEQNWNPQARSSDGGRGLAKIPPPTGSLIAFSTDAGNTAADGEGKNSIYCLSLAKNMQIENTTLDQVFRNVRSDVLKASNNTQRPVEASQLTGEAFYLKKGTYANELIIIDSLIETNQYDKALVIAISILNEDENNKFALIRRGRLYSFLDKHELAEADFNLAKKKYPNDSEVLMYQGRYYKAVGKLNEALLVLNNALKLDSMYIEALWQRGLVREYQEQFELALQDYSKAIQLDPKNPMKYVKRAIFFNKNLNEYDKAFNDYSKAIEIDSNNPDLWYERGIFIGNNGDDKLAINDFNKALSIDPLHGNSIRAIGIHYKLSGNYELAITELGKAIALVEINPAAAAASFAERAEVYIILGKFEDALSDYNKAIELFPKFSPYYEKRALLNSEYLDDFNAALIDYTKVIELNPSDPWAWYNRGFLNSYNHDDDKAAIHDFFQALRADSSFAPAHEEIGNLYYYNEMDKEAINEYTKAIGFAETYPISASNCFYYRAEIYSLQEKFELALQDHSKAIQLDPKNPSRYLNRAKFYIDYLNDYDKAYDDYSMAIEINPNNPDLWYERGLFIGNKGDNELAIADFNRALSIDPSHANTIKAIGVYYKQTGQLDLAIKQYGKGIALVNEEPAIAASSYARRSEIYILQEKFQDALLDLNKAIELFPKWSEYYRLRAQLYRDNLNDYQSALIDLTKVIELNPNDPWAWYNRGRFYRSWISNSEAAIKDFRAALKLDSTFISAVNAVGLYYMDMGQTDLAIDEYTKGTKVENENPRGAAYCYGNRAKIYETLNKIDEAENDYTKAVELDPSNIYRYEERSSFYVEFKKDYEAALNDLTKIIELESNKPWNWYRRAWHKYHFLKSNEGAIEDLLMALEIDPNYIPSLLKIGEIYYSTEDYDLAKKQLDKAIYWYEKNNLKADDGFIPYIAECFNYRGHVYRMQKKYNNSLSDYKKAIELNPDNANYYCELGNVYSVNLNQHYSAINQYTSAINIDSSSSWAWRCRAQTYKRLNDYKMAIRDSEYILSNIDSNDVITLNWIGAFYSYMHESEKAEKTYQKVLDKFNSNHKFSEYQISGGVAWSVTNLALNHERDLDYNQASDFYDWSVKLDSSNHKRFYYRSWFKFNSLKDEEGALLDADKAIQLEPENVTNLLSKVKLLEKSDRWEEAMILLKKTKKKFPKNETISLELARLHGLMGNNTLSDKEFNKLFSIKEKNSRFLNYQIEIKLNSNDLNSAHKLALECLSLFPKDTISRTYLADILFEQERYPASCREYTYLISMMENNEKYDIDEPHQGNISLSELYLKQSKTFEKMNDEQSQCYALKNALNNLYRIYHISDKKSFKKDIEERIKNICN